MPAQAPEPRSNKNNDKLVFDPFVTAKTNLAESSQIPQKSQMNLQNASHPSGIALKEEELTIYTDGSCIDNRKLNARCGGGIWISENHDYDRALRIPGHQSA